jgi:hypothetical protein
MKGGRRELAKVVRIEPRYQAPQGGEVRIRFADSSQRKVCCIRTLFPFHTNRGNRFVGGTRQCNQ